MPVAELQAISPSEFRVNYEQNSVRVKQSSADDGSFAIDDPEVEARRHRFVHHPWSWLQQPHGSDVLVVDRPGHRAGEAGDALITVAESSVLAVQTADCAPVAFFGSRPTGEVAIGVAHAGWRGLLAGVLQHTAHAIRRQGVDELRCIVGAHIHPECYRFDDDDLAPLVDRYGVALRSFTTGGHSALDMGAGVRSALAEVGVQIDASIDRCTACDPHLYSHRARGDAGRQVLAIWIEP